MHQREAWFTPCLEIACHFVSSVTRSELHCFTVSYAFCQFERSTFSWINFMPFNAVLMHGFLGTVYTIFERICISLKIIDCCFNVFPPNFNNGFIREFNIWNKLPTRALKSVASNPSINFTRDTKVRWKFN